MEETISQEGFPTLDTSKVLQQTLFDLEDLTVKSVTSIDELSKNLKELKRMLKDMYAANPSYVDQETKVKDVKKSLQQVKEQINTNQEVASLLQRAKDIQTELKDKTTAISDYALEYERLAKVDQIVKDGVTYNIVKSARLVKALQ